MSNRRFDGLSLAQPPLLLWTQAFELATVDDLLVGVVGIHAAKPKIDHNLFEGNTHVSCQVCCLFQNCIEGVTIVGIAGNVRAPSIRPLLWAITTPLFTPNS